MSTLSGITNFPSVQGITLMPHQQVHVDKMNKALDISPVIGDTSPMGLGKTACAGTLAKTRGLYLFVITMAGAINRWMEDAPKVGATIIGIYSYDKWRGQKGKNPSHGYLEYTGVKDEKKEDEDKLHYVPTQKLLDLIRNYPILVVADECDKIKKNSGRSIAVRALIRAVTNEVRNGSRSRVEVISATPSDGTEEQIVIFLRNLGFIRKRNLYWINPQTGEAKATGLEQLKLFCDYYNKEETENIFKKYGAITKRNSKAICDELFTKVLSPKIIFTMEHPGYGEFANDMKNAYLTLTREEDRLLAREGVQKLKDVTGWNNVTKEVTKKANKADMMSATRYFQLAEVYDTCVYVFRFLLNNPGSKAIITANYYEVIDKAAALMAHFNPIILTGKQNANTVRPELIRQFNEDPNRRLIIGNLEVIAYANNYHDTKGGEVRMMANLSNFHVAMTHQAAGRVERQGLKSKPLTRNIFVDEEELKIQDSIINQRNRKTAGMKKFISNEMKEKIVFPGDYPKVRIDEKGNEIPFEVPLKSD